MSEEQNRKEEEESERFVQQTSSAKKQTKKQQPKTVRQLVAYELMAQTFITLRLMHAGHRLPFGGRYNVYART